MKSTHQATKLCSLSDLEATRHSTAQVDWSSRSHLAWLESNWFLTIAQQSPDLIGAISIGGNWLCLNPSGRTLLRCTETLPFTAMLSESMQQRWNERILPQLLESGQWQGSFALLSQSEPVWFESQWFLLRDSYTNQPLGFATISRKIAPPEPTDAEDPKLHFLADAAHELKSPLAVMSTSIDLLGHDQLLIDRKRKHLRRLRSKVQQMSQLLDDILVLSRSEHIGLRMSEIDLVQACTECVEEAQMNTEQHEIVFTADGSPGAIVTDASLVQRILVNLLCNSIKYSPNGGRVLCQLSIEPHQFTLKIQDSGIGIAIAEQSRLFQSFYRASNAGQIAGTGLGLAIVQRCVDRLNGQITLESAIGTGTTFTVKIPTESILEC